MDEHCLNGWLALCKGDLRLFDQQAISLACACWQFHPIFIGCPKNNAHSNHGDEGSKMKVVTCSLSYALLSLSIFYQLQQQYRTQNAPAGFFYPREQIDSVRLLLATAPMPADMVIENVTPESGVPWLLLLLNLISQIQGLKLHFRFIHYISCGHTIQDVVARGRISLHFAIESNRSRQSGGP